MEEEQGMSEGPQEVEVQPGGTRETQEGVFQSVREAKEAGGRHRERGRGDDGLQGG
jgi:hypothetical protein